MFDLDVYSLLGWLVVAVRRSSLGRRLVALKDTPEACRTLGMNLVGSKLAAFALSAGIAGLAGAISGQIYQADSFALESSMAVTMLGVVGGIGAVSGALFGGLMLGAFQSLFATVFAVNKVGWFSVWSISVAELLKVGPGLMGMNLGKNPSGASSQISEGFEPVAKVPAAWITAIVGFCALWLAAFTEVIGNWGFVAGLFVGLLGVAPLLPYVFGPDESGPAEVGIAEGGTAKNVSSRRAVALILGVAVVGAFALIDWNTAVGSNGLRIVIFIVSGVVLGRVLLGIAGIEDPRKAEAVDANDIGLTEPIGRSSLLEIDRALDLVGVSEVAS